MSWARWLAGQSMVEFAVLAPVLTLLVFGLLDFGRAAYFQAESTDAARDGARVFAAAVTATDGTVIGGPGYGAICQEVTNDLNNFAHVTCHQVSTPPPYALGSEDYPSTPDADTALALIYCGDAADCQSTTHSSDLCDTSDSPAQHTCGSVTVYYGFRLLTPLISSLFGERLVFVNSGSFVSAW